MFLFLVAGQLLYWNGKHNIWVKYGENTCSPKVRIMVTIKKCLWTFLVVIFSVARFVIIVHCHISHFCQTHAFTLNSFFIPEILLNFWICVNFWICEFVIFWICVQFSKKAAHLLVAIFHPVISIEEGTYNITETSNVLIMDTNLY